MEVNLTFFVQIVNFMLAYGLLRFFFFSPALKLIVQEEQDRYSAYSRLQEHELSLENDHKRVALAWQQCRAYFAEHTPCMLETEVDFFRNIVPVFSPHSSESVDLIKQQKLLKDAIIKEVGHVRS